MHHNRDRVIENAREATTEDLLDRVTVYRAGMESEAIDIIEAELYRRGFGHRQIEAHAAERNQIIATTDGVAVRCSSCARPAVEERWGWHYWSPMIWGDRRPLFPIFPRRFFYCQEHRPTPAERPEE